MSESDDDPMMADPFSVLDVDEEADDETIRRRYLALVRRHPPERDPERFRAVRAAYEAIRGRRDRLRVRLLTIHGAALLRLKRACLEPAGDGPGRPGRAAVQALLREGADRIWADRVLSDAKR
ncbi:MAG TPA: J domain-containing protein [Stellaceae bacterium]